MEKASEFVPCNHGLQSPSMNEPKFCEFGLGHENAGQHTFEALTWSESHPWEVVIESSR
jgi:hypothetical protein